MAKKNVIVIYGGVSTEHEISCRSAKFVFENLSRDKYNVFPIGISKKGQWIYMDEKKLMKSIEKTVPLNSDFQLESITPIDSTKFHTSDIFLNPFGISEEKENTVVWLMIHGTNGEDGRMQGLLEMSSLAYVGCSSLGSVLGIDKSIAKKLVAAVGVDVVPWVDLYGENYYSSADKGIELVEETLSYPVYVKPATLGSSVGVHKVKNRQELKTALADAFSYDDKVLVEQGLQVREIECAALGSTKQYKISTPGEVNASAEHFYSYEEKYIDSNAASINIPANLDEFMSKEANAICAKVYEALDLFGLARIDLFLDRKSNRFYFNEVNTIPGFTDISQYPMLWRYDGYTGTQLLNELINLSFDRQKCKSLLKTDFLV